MFRHCCTKGASNIFKYFRIDIHWEGFEKVLLMRILMTSKIFQSLKVKANTPFSKIHEYLCRQIFELCSLHAGRRRLCALIPIQQVLCIGEHRASPSQRAQSMADTKSEIQHLLDFIFPISQSIDSVACLVVKFFRYNGEGKKGLAISLPHSCQRSK